MLRKVLILWLAIIFIHSHGLAADKTAEQIVAQVDKILGLTDIKSVQTMTVYRKDGTVRLYKMNVMTKGDEKAFAEITAPPREKGRQTLKVGDVVWSYLPSVKKSIRVSGRGSFMGGDFENNDVLRLNLVRDYKAKITEELSDQYILSLKGTDLSLSYAKIKLWVRKSDSQPVKQEYYTISDKLIKSTIYEDIKDFGGCVRPARLVMQSALHPKQKTQLEIIKYKKGVKNPSSVFKRSNLGR
jgi:outer membrane lipoprotein-sorting protein